MTKVKRNMIARQLIGIAKQLLKNERLAYADSMGHDDIIEFLDSQVKSVVIIVHLPDNDPSDDTARNAADKYRNKRKNNNDEFMRDVQKEQEAVARINDKWKALEKTVESLPNDNGGNPFYGDLAVEVLKTRSITVSFLNRTRHLDNTGPSDDPHNDINKNNPFLYEGIDTVNDYRDFLINKFNSHQMNFKECLAHPDNFDMPLDVYLTKAKIKNADQEINVYVKFGIHNCGTSAQIELEFENFSFHA